MSEPAPNAEPQRDPYDGVPLGVEAMVPLLHAAAETERSDDENAGSVWITEKDNPRDHIAAVIRGARRGHYPSLLPKGTAS